MVRWSYPNDVPEAAYTSCELPPFLRLHNKAEDTPAGAAKDDEHEPPGKAKAADDDGAGEDADEEEEEDGDTVAAHLAGGVATHVLLLLRCRKGGWSASV